MKASVYKQLRSFRQEMRKILDDEKIWDDPERDQKFKRAFDALYSSREEYKFLGKIWYDKLFHICLHDQSPTARHKINDILGRKNHLFHIVFPSVWPFPTSASVLLPLSSFVFYFNGTGSLNLISLAFVLLLGSVIGWFCVIVDEATYKGHHTLVVRSGLRLGFILFTISEIILFLSMFWGFFHLTLSPAIQVGYLVPATGVPNVSYAGVPFSNTCLLTCSSLSITWAHKGLEYGSFKTTLDGLFVTIFLGLTFLILQINEYRSCYSNISDGAYPSIFYVLTGLHGTHVFIGLIWLIISLFRLLSRHFTITHHLGFLFGIWYWHFVDIIWTFVYFTIYIWLANAVFEFLVITVCVVFPLPYVANR